MSKSATAANPGDIDVLEGLVRRVEAQPDSMAALATLVYGLADQIKATSNDQNVQRLARALHAAAPALTDSITAKDTRRAA